MSAALDVQSDFDRLREPVWARFTARHPVYSRERFEDAYSEWWTREIERDARGRPSRPGMPIPFIADAVHRVLIDEGRMLARGLARGEAKWSLELVELDGPELADAQADGDDGTYRVVVHRIVALVQRRLTPREMAVFVASFLYLRSVPTVASLLRLSEPRVKKDRARIVSKIGAEVWALLQDELDLCEGYDAQRLPAILELLTVHVDGCVHCREQLLAVRDAAHAVVGPVELLVVTSVGTGAAGVGVPDDLAEHATGSVGGLFHRLSRWIDEALGRLSGAGHRALELGTSVPPAGRTGALLGALAALLAGGGYAVEQATDGAPRAAVTPARTPTAVATVSQVLPRRTPDPIVTATPTPRPRKASSRRSKQSGGSPNKTQGPTTNRGHQTTPASPAPAGSLPDGQSEFNPSSAASEAAPAPIPAGPGGSEFGP